jgi:hypothetical protein
MTSTERRNYFRVDSELMLKCLSVSADTVEHSQPEDQFPEDRHASYLIHELQRLDQEAQPHLLALSDLNRTLAQCLKLLNKKIDLVAQHSASQHTKSTSDDDSQRPISKVNLSEGGIAFYTSTPWPVGEHLALSLQFLNDYAALTCFATVLRCEPCPHQASYKIACQFYRLSADGQEMLKKHIMQTQLNAIRLQKQTPTL